jgi:hypothetical protein
MKMEMQMRDNKVRDNKVSVVKTLGEVVNVVQERPVIRSIHAKDLIAGNTLTFLDLRLVNQQGAEKVIRVPVPPEVSDFYTTEARDWFSATR